MNEFVQAVATDGRKHSGAYEHMTQHIVRIQAGQLVHDLRTVPQNGVEFQEAVQRLLQTTQFLIG